MTDRQRIFRNLLLLSIFSLTIAVIFFIGSIRLLYALRPMVEAESEPAWSLMEGITGLMALALATGGGVFALVEYVRSENEQAQREEERREREEERRKREAEQSFSLYQAIFDHLMKEEDIAARRWIIQNIPKPEQDPPGEEWILRVRKMIFAKPPGKEGEIAPGHRYVKQVLNTFDYLGFTAIHYWDPEGPLMEWVNPSIVKVWERIGPYIEEEARRRDEPDYYESARIFGKMCIKWRKEQNYPEPKIVKWAL